MPARRSSLDQMTTNRPPVANDDQFSTGEGTPLTIGDHLRAD